MSDRTPSDRDEQDRVIHECDGIKEYDNRLPNWWLYTLYGAIVFAVVYWFQYHVFRASDLPGASYAKEMAAEKAREEATPVSVEALVTASKDNSAVATGKDVFGQNCAACHGANGAGNIGPNLTDAYWLHGGAPDRVFKTIYEGVPAKGMPAWKGPLGKERIQSVVGYLLTIQNTNVAGKGPEGDKTL